MLHYFVRINFRFNGYSNRFCHRVRVDIVHFGKLFFSTFTFPFFQFFQVPFPAKVWIGISYLSHVDSCAGQCKWLVIQSASYLFPHTIVCDSSELEEKVGSVNVAHAFAYGKVGGELTLRRDTGTILRCD